MSEGVRHRGGGEGTEDDAILTEDNVEKLTSELRKSTTAGDETTPLIDSALASLPQRWRNWVIRGLFSFILISVFSALVYLGPVALMILILVIQLKCFKEIIDIGHAVYRIYDLPWFRALSWYLLFCSNYFFVGETLIENWGIVLRKENLLALFVRYHRFLAFTAYIGGFVWFVLSLRKGYYMRQFSLFAYTHVALFFVVLGALFLSQNIIHGIIWFLVPVSMIICNDIMAYMFGFFFGKTSLIELSPKKTWEGFIGGAFSTIIFGIVLSAWLCRFPYFVCPLADMEADGSCLIPPSFIQKDYELPGILYPLAKLLRRSTSVSIKPFLLHAAVMSVFASIVGPFGGFFASGFKRAFKIKDFGAVIPGHGGLMDRFDCQLLMGAFVWVYIQSFIKIPNPQRIVADILFLAPEAQVQVFSLLRDSLEQSGLLDSAGQPLPIPPE